MTVLYDKDVRVTVNSTYQGRAVSAHDSYMVWSYDVVIENHTESPIQVISRYWQLIDANGILKEVTGQGVVGMQPIINPGQSYGYTSFANIRTSCGMVLGKYYVRNIETHEEFVVEIPAFSLDSPEEKQRVH